jgi:hypothetical protein
MTEQEKREKATRIIDREIEKLKGGWSACSCAMIRQEMLERMFADIEKLQPKKEEKLGAIKRILRAVKSNFLSKER